MNWLCFCPSQSCSWRRNFLLVSRLLVSTNVGYCKATFSSLVVPLCWIVWIRTKILSHNNALSKFLAKPSLSVWQSHHTLLFYSSITLLNSLISLGTLYFKNVGQVVMMEWMVFFRNVGKEDHHCHNSPVVLMKIFFFLSLFAQLCSFYSPFKRTTFNMDGISYYMFFCVCLHLFVQLMYIYCTTIFMLADRNFKGHCGRPTQLSYGCHNEMVSCMIVQRKLKEKVVYTHTWGKKKYLTINQMMHRYETERDGEGRKTDRQTERGGERCVLIKHIIFVSCIMIILSGLQAMMKVEHEHIKHSHEHTHTQTCMYTMTLSLPSQDQNHAT